MNTRTWKRRAVFFLIAVALSNVVFLWYGRGFIVQGYGDFTSFYTAGKLVQRGQASELYDRSSQWEVQQEFASSVRIRRHALPYIRPPFEALLFLPLAYLPYPVACLVWMAFKILILFLTLFLLRVYVPLHSLVCLSTPLLALLCLSASPVAFDLLQGQDAILLLFVFGLVFVALVRKAELMAGVFLGVGLFKFHLVIPVLLVFALRRKTRLVGGFILSAATLLLISAALVGWNGLLAYPKYLWDLSRDPLSGVIPPEIMPNLNGFVTSVADRCGRHAYADWLAAPIFFGGIAFVARAWRSTDDVDDRLIGAGFSLCIVTLLPTSYYLSGYDMALLILPILVMGDCFFSCGVNRWLPKVFFFSIGVLLFVPAYWVLIIPAKRAYWMPIVLTALVPTIACTLAACRSSKANYKAP
jgi:alpha-1,2-mannosyltransferase